MLFMSCGHLFEIYTIVADIDDRIDLVFGFKNMTETEGMLNTRTGHYDFIGRSIPIYPCNDLHVQPGDKVYLKIKAPFSEKISGRAIAKFFCNHETHTLRLRFQNNQGVVEFGDKGKKEAKL